MLWAYLFFLTILSGNLCGEDLDWIDKSGIRFQLSESGDERPWPIIQQTRTGEVRCDCGLFVQIAAQLMTHSKENAVLLPPAENFPEAIACACGLDLVYLRTENQSTHESLQRTSFMNKGMWLMPVGGDQYLGLSSDGPIVATEEEWSSRLEKGLLCEMELSHIPESQQRYVRFLIKRGIVGQWSMDRFSSMWPYEHRQDLERILIQVRHSN